MTLALLSMPTLAARGRALRLASSSNVVLVAR